MKLLSLLLITFLSYEVSADEMQEIKRLTQQTPSIVRAEVILAHPLVIQEKPVSTYLGTIEPEIKVKPQEALHFSVGDNYVEISSKSALIVRTLGVSIKVSHVLYNKEQGTFVADTSLPLNLGNGISNQIAVSVMKKTYKDRLDKLIGEIKKAKIKSDLRSIEKLTSEIPEILGIDKKIVKTIVASGKAELILNPEKDINMEMGEFQVKISKIDRPRISMEFEKNKEQFQLGELRLLSPEGLKIYNAPQFSKYAYVKLYSTTINQAGVTPDYRISAEDAISGLVSLVKTMGYASASQNGNINSYPGVELTAFRELLDKKIKINVKKLVHDNQEELLSAGIKPEIVQATQK